MSQLTQLDASKLRVFKSLLMKNGATMTVENTNGTTTTIDLAELAALDSIAAADLAKIDGITNGTGAAGKALVLDSSGDVTNGVGQIRMTGATLATAAGTGITAGSGTVYASSIQNIGGMFITRILIDLTGLNSQATDLDIIGVDATANPCHLGRIVAADSGTILGGIMRCLEVPAGGDPNIALYSANESTGVEDGLISDLTETLLFDPNADWTIDMSRSLTGMPPANDYLYLVQGDATGTNATYTAGKFLIELYGY